MSKLNAGLINPQLAKAAHAAALQDLAGAYRQGHSLAYRAFNRLIVE
jgi:hypothetical protein